MFNFFKTAPKESYKTIQGKVVLVKEWPVPEDKNPSWGRSGYDSLYK